MTSVAYGAPRVACGLLSAARVGGGSSKTVAPPAPTVSAPKPPQRHPWQPSIKGSARSGIAAGAWQNPVLGLGAAAQLAAMRTLDLEGMPELDPDPLMATFIGLSGDDGVLISVRYGDLAYGKLAVRLDDNGYQADPTMLGFEHPEIAARNGVRLVLVVHVDNSRVSGYLGAYQNMTSIGSPGAPIHRHDETLMPVLFGRAYHGPDSVWLVTWINELSAGQLDVAAGFTVLPPDGPPITGGLAMVNEAYAFKATSKLEVAGLAPVTADITRTRHGILSALLPSLDVSHAWKTQGFQGSISASYFDGSFEAIGKLTFAYPAAKPRLRGDVTVIATSAEKAWAAARSHDPAPVVTGGLHPTEPGRAMALAGFGTLSLEIAKGFDASAAFVVDPEGYVTARGVLRAPRVVELVKAYTYGGSNNDQAKKLAPWERKWKWPVGSLPLFLGLDADLRVEVALVPEIVVGPLTLHDIALTGLYSTRPGTGTMIDITGSLNASASAALVASAKLIGAIKVGFDVTIPILDWNLSMDTISVHVGVEGRAALKAYADLAVKITRSTVADPMAEPDYNLKAHLEAAGQASLSAHLTGGLDLFGFWKPSLSTGDLSYNIDIDRGFSVDLDHTLGHPIDSDELKLQFGKPQFDPHKFVSAMKGSGSAPRFSDRYRGKASDPKAGTQVPVRDAPIALPAEPKPDRELEVPFSVEHHPHRLWLSLGPPPRIDIATTRRPISPVLEIAAERVTFAMPWASTAEARELLLQQHAELIRLAKQARALENDAGSLGTDTTGFFDAELPGVQELAEALVEYGERYDDPEFEGRTRVSSSPLEEPDVGTEQDVLPGTLMTTTEAEVLQWFANHGLTYDPATNTASKMLRGESLVVRMEGDSWVAIRGGVEVAREYAMPLYVDKPAGHDYLFNAHHPVQNAWATARLGRFAPGVLKDPNLYYRSADEPTIVLRDRYLGSPHQKITARQKSREGSITDRDYGNERDQMKLDLVAARVPGNIASEVGRLVDAYFKTIHDNIKDDKLRTHLFGTYFPP